MASNNQIKFEASAYLQTLIGRELIRSEALALIELVKNAYDSNAKNVIVTVRPPGPKEPGEIEVRDNGSGMSLTQFKRSFMFAGFSDKPNKTLSGDRVPTGEKGIGRFAADRLGQKLSVLTKTESASSAIQVDIDWSLFDSRTKKFSDVAVEPKDVPSPFPVGESGTILRINRLRQAWDRSQILSLRQALAQLMDPYHKPTDFTIDLQVVGSPALSGEILQPPIGEADIQIEFRVLADGSVQRSRRGRLYGTAEKETIPQAVDLSGLQKLRGRFFYFLRRPSKEESKGLLPGVRLYRDGFRVEPLGSHSADWLGVAEKRAKRAGHAHIVPTRLFGFVTVSRVTNPELKDTTSREALIDTPEVRALVSLLRQQLDFLEDSIETDVSEPRWKESRERKAVALEQARLQSLSIMSFGLGHELRQPLQSIRFEAGNIAKRVKQLKIQDQDIEEAQRNIDADIERIDKNIKMIASISSGSLEQNQEIDVARIIDDQARLFETRCTAHGIELDVQVGNHAPASANETLIGIVVVNLIKNAIDALVEIGDGRKKKIVVALRDDGSRYAVDIADNAMGVPQDIQAKIFKKFGTRKTGGWGVGLYNCKLFLQSHGGDISFHTDPGAGTIFTFTLPKVGINANTSPGGG
jgi:signal transduction histidine kinase